MPSSSSRPSPGPWSKPPDDRFDRLATLSIAVAVGATIGYALLTGLFRVHTAPPPRHALVFGNEAMEAVRLALVQATVG